MAKQIEIQTADRDRPEQGMKRLGQWTPRQADLGDAVAWADFHEAVRASNHLMEAEGKLVGIPERELVAIQLIYGKAGT